MAERSRQPKVRIRLRRYDGRWYAHAKGGPKKQRNMALWVAISFCRRLNAKAEGAAHG